MADQIEEGEIAEGMVRDSGKDRDRPRSKSGTHSRSRDNDRRMSKEDSRSTDSSNKKSSQKSETSKSSSAAPAKDPLSSESNVAKTLNPDQSAQIMLDKKEIYESVIKYENQLAASTDVEDEREFLYTCEDFQEVLKDIEELKSGKFEEEELEELKCEGILLLGKLRQLNRISKLRLKLVKDDAFKCRQEVDGNHLLLQNLLYEATHLNKQVEAVQSYKGQDEEIDLIPVEKFYQEAPPNISKPELTKYNDHFLRIARLEYEFILRQELTNHCVELEKAKDNVSGSIESARKKLDSLRPLLNTVLESTKPVQEFFGMNLWKERRELQTSHYLPVPLYVLFVQSSAYKDALKLSGGEFSVQICGDVDTAKDYVEDETSEEHHEEESDSDMECDVDENENADGELSDRRKSRKSRKGSMAAVTRLNLKKKLVQVHPLYVEWTLKIPSGECLRIHFSYATKLQIVTVKSRIDGGVFSHKVPPMLHQSDSILTGLFPEDTGMDSPNPVTHFYLQKAEVDNFSELVPELGRPYIWAQKVAGLNFPALVQEDASFSSCRRVEPSVKYSSMKIETTVQKLFERLRNQMKLWSQIQAIESRNLSIPVGVRQQFPPKISTNFVSWEALPWQGDTHMQQVARSLLRTKKLDANPELKDMLFRAVVERGRVRLNAFVLVGMNFPSVPPIFMLFLERDGSESDWTNDIALRDVEAEVNRYAPQDFIDWREVLLILQIQRMMYCLDILLETDHLLNEASGPSEFGRDKLFTTPTRGRNLRRPLDYKPSGTFTQRF